MKRNFSPLVGLIFFASASFAQLKVAAPMGNSNADLSDLTMNEGDRATTKFVLRVTKTRGAGSRSPVNFQTMDGSATLTNDLAGSGVVTITPATSPTSTDNDYTRINNAVQAAVAGQTIKLLGTFDWTEPNAAASWAAGSNGVAGDLDDYSILVPAGLNNVTFTADNLGDGTIQGPGDLANVDLEGVFFFDSDNGSKNQDWTISNIRFLDFDVPIGMYLETAGAPDAYSNTHIIGNYILLATDLAGSTSGGVDNSQNTAIYISQGKDQVISGNAIDLRGDGVSAPDATTFDQFSTEVAMQSSTSSGDLYDGLQITNNTIHVLNAQSATPEQLEGIWENSQAHSSNITVSGNTFVNLAGGNDPATNIQRGFRVTAHSSATTTVTFASNSVTGANIGFEWLPGQTFAGNQPVRLTSNTITGNGTGVFVQSQGSAYLKDNTITGNGAGSAGVIAINGLTTVDVVGTTISGTANAIVVDATNSGTDPVTMRITNSTLSASTATSGGALHCVGVGGIANTTVTNSTLSENSPSGSSIFLKNASLTVGNSIFNSRSPGTNMSATGTSAVTSLGYNLSSDDFGGFLTSTGDQTNTNPMLGPLKDNGGPTLTYAPLSNSAAIDRGKDLGPVGPSYSAVGEDQRGSMRPVTYDASITSPPGGDRSDIGAVELLPGVLPVSAVSRKTHGGAGDFDINLPLTGVVGVECRSGGANNDYEVVITFASPVTFSSAAVTDGTGSVALSTGSGTTTVTVDLTGVTNAQRLTLALFDVNDGVHSGDVGIRMGVLIGDTSGNGAVTATDVSQTKLQSGQAVTAANFREDVLANGAINATDVSTVKLRSGTALP